MGVSVSFSNMDLIEMDQKPTEEIRQKRFGNFSRFLWLSDNRGGPGKNTEPVTMQAVFWGAAKGSDLGGNFAVNEEFVSIRFIFWGSFGVNKPLIRPYFWGGVALGGVARIPMIITLPKRMSFEIKTLLIVLWFPVKNWT